MATFIPEIDRTHWLDAFPNAAERLTAQAIDEQFPKGTLVFHGLEFIRRRGGPNDHAGRIFSGEADFVLLIPGKEDATAAADKGGLLLLEVKSGTWRYNDRAATWEQPPLDRDGGERPEREPWRRRDSPFSQASGNSYAIRDEISREYARGVLPFAHGHAVFLPEMRQAGGEAGCGHFTVLFTGTDSPRLAERVRATVGRWGSDDARPMTAAQVEVCRRSLSRRLDLLPLLSTRVSAAEEVLVRMTQEQLDTMRESFENPRMLVRGVAGSGKTMLAVARAEAFAAEGKDVLLLCYTKALANHVRQRLDPELAPRITCVHFHGFAAQVVREHGRVPFSPPQQDGGDSADFWENVAPNLLMDALPSYPKRFDAAVVDEAQDFRPLWWMVVDELLKHGSSSPLYVFMDEAQNVFKTQEMLPGGEASFYRRRLTRNCRNTRRINDFCRTVVNVATESDTRMPPGDTPLEHRVQTDKDRADAAEGQIREWLTAGLAPSQIAILSHRQASNTSLGSRTSLAGQAVVDDVDAWQDGQGVLHTTVRGFKGLEADAVLLLDARVGQGHFDKPDYYVACSRAKHCLTILHTGA